MLKYLQGTDIDFLVEYKDREGNPVDPVSVSWKLYDEDDDVLASADLSDEAGTSVTITITADNNALTGTESTEGRRLSVELILADGTALIQEVYYLIESESVLVLGQNTFMSMVGALNLATSLATLAGWSTASAEARQSSLVQAYLNISSMPLRSSAAGTDVDERHLDLYGSKPATARDYDKADFGLMTDNFKKDFRLAQLIEADYLLGGDGVEKLRAQGIMSYTVGEVKQFYRTQTPLELNVSKAALRHIGKYIMYNRKLARA